MTRNPMDPSSRDGLLQLPLPPRYHAEPSPFVPGTLRVYFDGDSGVANGGQWVEFSASEMDALGPEGVVETAMRLLSRFEV